MQSPLISLVEYHANQATLNIDKGAAKLEKARDMKIKKLKVNITGFNVEAIEDPFCFLIH